MLYLTSHSMWCLWTEAILGIGPLPPRGLHVHDNGIQDHVVDKAIGQTRFVYVTAQHAGSIFCHVHFEWTLAALSAPQILDMVEAFEASNQCRFFLVLSLLPKNPLGESLPWLPISFTWHATSLFLSNSQYGHQQDAICMQIVMENLWILHLSVMQEHIYKPRSEQLHHAIVNGEKKKEEGIWEGRRNLRLLNKWNGI